MKRMSCLTAIALLLTSAPALPSRNPAPDGAGQSHPRSDLQRHPGFPHCRRFPLGNADRVFARRARRACRAWRYGIVGGRPGRKFAVHQTPRTGGGDQPDRHHPFQPRAIAPIHSSCRRGAGPSARVPPIPSSRSCSAIRAKKRPLRRRRQRRQPIPRPSRCKQARSARRSISPSSKASETCRYSVQGSSAIQPSEITDNGQFTALRFPNQRELPAFFAVNPDGSESIVPFDVRDEFVVIHGVFAQLRLRRGREVLCVFNEAPDFYGRDPKTGTASSIVERTPRQGDGERK